MLSWIVRLLYVILLDYYIIFTGQLISKKHFTGVVGYGEANFDYFIYCWAV